MIGDKKNFKIFNIVAEFKLKIFIIKKGTIYDG